MTHRQQKTRLSRGETGQSIGRRDWTRTNDPYHVKVPETYFSPLKNTNPDVKP